MIDLVTADVPVRICQVPRHALQDGPRRAGLPHDLYGTQVIVTPGAPQTSQLYQRMKVRNLDQMPPLGTELADDAALATVGQWITGLPP